MRTLLNGMAALVCCLIAGSLSAGSAHSAEALDPSTGGGTSLLTAGPVSIKMLVDRSLLPDGEVEIGVLTLPAGYTSSGNHRHGSTEIFYVLEGRLIHRLNGATHILDPGMVGVVRKGDEIDHGVDGDVPVKALVVWVPGGEAERLIEGGFKSTPLD